MKTLRRMVHRIRGLFTGRGPEIEMAEEFTEHIRMQTDDNIRAGMDPETAELEARIKFGSLPATTEEWRDRRGVPFLETLWKDVVYALRVLGQKKGWTVVAVLSIGLGIGANAALFSFVHALFLDELPVPASGDLVAFRWVGPNTVSGSTYNYGGVSAPEGERAGATFTLEAYEAFQAESETLSEVFASATGGVLNLIADGVADVASSEFVSGNYFRGLGVTASAGRLLTPEDDAPGADLALVVSYEYWTSRFGRDPDIAGRSVSLNGMSATIAGVAPPGLGSVRRVGRATPDLMIPLVMEPRMRPDASRSQPNSWWLLVIGRLRPGTTAEQARANLEPAFRGAAIEAYDIWRTTASEEQLAVRGDPEIPRLTLVPGNRGSYDVSNVAARPLPVIAAVFGIVLLIVAVNVANLMLSRTESRHHELAVRRAIGAGRWRLIRQLLTESVVLAVMGGGAGLAVAYASRGLFATLGASAGLVGVPVLTLETLVFAAAASFLTGLLFGAVPAWRASRGGETIGAYSAGLRANASRSRLGKSLVVAQVSLSLILLVSAGLFLETLTNLRAVDTGFNSENLVVFTVDPAFGAYEGEEARDMYERMLGAFEDAPGVRAVSYSSYPLLSGVFLTTPIRPQRTDSPSQVSFMSVHHSFFDTMEMPLVLGRGFSPADNQASPAVAVINETAARELFPDSTPVGERFGRFGEDGFPVEIIGVVQDTKYSTVRRNPPPMVFYAEAQQERVESQAFAVRTVESPEITLPALRAAVRNVDPDLPLLSVTTQQALEAGLLRSERMFASTATVFGGLALTVAAIGLFGLMSYTVTRRTREIGIRIALGARNDRILGEILRESFVVVGIGVVFGLAGALAATRFVESMLFGLERTDPSTIVAAVVIMLAVSLVAAYVPSWKASRVNPIVALRHE